MHPTFAQTLFKTRVVAFALLVIFSLAVLIANGHFTHRMLRDEITLRLIIPPFISLNLAVSAVTLVTLLVMLIMGFIKHNTSVCWLISEIIWLGVLDLLWLTTSAWTTAQWLPGASKICIEEELLKPPSDLPSICADYQVSLAFGWMGWILMSVYSGALLTFAITLAKRGNPMWKSSLRTVGSGKAASSESQDGQPRQPYITSAPKEVV